MTRILIADDHAAVREGLKHIIDKAPDMIVGGEASNGFEALEKIQNERWDLVLLDITMPGKSGIEVLKEIRQKHPELPVLILSVHPEELYASRALRAGASGYLTKETVPAQLVAAIRKVSAGDKYFSSSLADRLSPEMDPDRKKPAHDALSDREYQVFIMLAAGKTIKEIADELETSVTSVSMRRRRLLAKTNLRNDAELTRYAVLNRLVHSERFDSCNRVCSTNNDSGNSQVTTRKLKFER